MHCSDEQKKYIDINKMDSSESIQCLYEKQKCGNILVLKAYLVEDDCDRKNFGFDCTVQGNQQ